MSDQMRGIQKAKQAVQDTLEAEFNAYLVGLRTAWGLTALTLPDVATVKRNEPQALDRWPMLAVSGVRSGTARFEVTDEANVAYLRTYTLRLFVWVRSEGWDATIDQRDNLSAAVVQFVLDHPTLSDDAGLTVAEESDLAEEFSDVTPVKGDRFVAGSYVEFDVELYEVIHRAPSGNVETTLVTGDILPHPALE